ncbi:hypothetical protein Hmuk_2124 [Halomicrobium mukohataei DSM 12286]|uniref:Uncharacterized protein n=1 Tax=Halomicrobium mukohataei (strain ATCC 700874 / DSM 12286 / JCM 9738 / NCIMB 13541) TaxID=485914 RepID=C7NWM7_HALMD|nr:hypothetical protein Hmuk_2124 [Halomicrobium mukohataei DSM 12286]
MTGGCLGLGVSADDDQTGAGVFQSHRYEGRQLIVQFQERAEIEEAVLVDRALDRQYQRIARPADRAYFDVVFPDRLESSLSKNLYVKAKTAGGWVSEWVWEPVHGAAKNIEVGSDGSVAFDIHNTGAAPLLVRFVGIYGDVPNSTVDLQADSFEREALEFGPGVVGAGDNRPLDPSRGDLVVGPGETARFETVYRPFAFEDGAPAGSCDGTERTGDIGIVHASGTITSYTFSYRGSGGRVAAETDASASQQGVEACDTVTTSR